MPPFVLHTSAAVRAKIVINTASVFTKNIFLHIIFYRKIQEESYMAYYNGNYRAGQRQPMMTCPNQAHNRQSNGCGRNTATPQPCCNAAAPQNELPNTSEKMCMIQPRTTPAEGIAQSCVTPSPYCPVAMAYVPFQMFEELFEESKAFTVGTAFPSLLKPFMRGGRCR